MHPAKSPISGAFAQVVVPGLGFGHRRSVSLCCTFAALVTMLAPAVLTQCQSSAQGADQVSPTTQSVDASGITNVSRSGPALTEPQGDPKGQVLKYGLGLVFQVAPRTAAVLCNIRTVGEGHWDFENGTDVVVFNDLATLGQQKRMVIARSKEDQNPARDKKRVAVVYPIQVGFVPLEAKRLDGSAHPHAGTGFGFSHALCFDLNDQGYYTPYEANKAGQRPSATRWFVHQFAYAGEGFRVVKEVTMLADAPLKTADGAWALTAPGMSAAIADGDDLLLPVSANDGKRNAVGVSRWHHTGGNWHPVAFFDISVGMEPSLIRDIDGSLLYSVRGNRDEGQAVRVWRSSNGGQNWEQVLHLPTLRSNAPVVLNQAADGTPYVAANRPGSFRATLCLWPLNAQRSDCGPAITARNCTDEFGSSPEGTTWFVDHATATTVQLADGQWHNVLGYRVMAFSTTGVGGETLTPQTGCYIEEVLSAGPAQPAWQF